MTDILACSTRRLKFAARRVVGAGGAQNHAASHIRAAQSLGATTTVRVRPLAEVPQQSQQTFVDAHRCERAAPLVDKANMASTSTGSPSSTPDDGLPDPRRLFPPVATAGLETLPSTHDVSGLEPAPPPPAAPLQSPKKKKGPLLLFCSCT